MKQIRRAEMENERLEERDNDNDNDAKKFTAEAKGGKAKADNFTETKGNKAKGGLPRNRSKGRQSKD